MSIAELAQGKWTLKSSDNFEEYMKALGVGMATRMIVSKLKPDIHIESNGDSWTIKTSSTFKNTENTFKIGDAAKETTPDGRDVEATHSIEENKLIRSETGTVATKTTREFTKDTQTVTLECNGVVCVRVYEKA